MILYRGTPVPESTPRAKAYACPFFSPDFEYAAEYGLYVQKYRAGPQRILDFRDPAARRLTFEFTGHQPARHMNDPVMLNLFWHPTDEWRDFIAAAGYTGTAMGWNICLFDPGELKLLGRWRIDWSKGQPRRVL